MSVPSSSAPAVPSDRTVLSSLLHRLGSPLGALVNYVHLADEGTYTDPLARDAWAGIHSALKDLRAALEGGRRWLNALDGDVHPRRPLEEVIDAAAQRVPNLDVRKHLAAADGALVSVAVEDMLVELFENASRCGGARSVTLQATREPPARQLRLTVDDDGCGWPADAAERAFEPFRRLAARGEPLPDGAGCGLSIVALMAKRLGGEAWGEPAPEGGARVVFTLADA